ncbi:hypothetical protein V6B05_01265 [Lactococcus garvieae]|uniref:hypothetical protein n=1 Tax=Lactococcus garvieae TaxID=1363 RepID=UPI001F61AFEA|nr:hypothetical protein [Lactococcus garvieae]MCI3860057.1 hypothetical protein [Lactococcus garvieae]
MACASCKGSTSSSLSTNSGNSCGSCSKRQVMDTEKPLEQIQNGDKNFCFTEITDEICENLHANEGIHPSVTNSNTDCDDLSALNDLGIGDLNNHLIPLDMCDVEAWKCWLFSLLSWMWNINKAIICAICGLWDAVVCIDKKTRNSVRVVKLWEGEKNIFDLPTIDVSEDMNQFDYLDLHVLCGTERVVSRMSLASGTGGIPTNSILDRIGRNESYGMGDGAVAAKEIGIGFNSNKRFHIDHFIWSINGTNPSKLNETGPGVFITFENTAKTKAYNDSQNTLTDRPHKILQVDGIISRDTGSCIK